MLGRQDDGDKMKEAREGPVIKGLGFQGNTGVGQMFARFMESTDVLPCGAGPVGWEKEFKRRNNGMPNSVSIP